jgi:FGGY-family pentulose kinase
MPGLVAAVDVGTGSARAGIFDAAGRMLGRGESPIDTHSAAPLHAEQDSAQIWAAVCAALAAARAEAGARPSEVAGLAFDATCSLVVRDAAGAPVPASVTGEPRWDTVLWLDHRARAEADECTATGHRVLGHLGGSMSPEMAIPKLMWLKRHLPESWARASRIMDLSDYLAWRATGTAARSQCTLACKWTWLAHEAPGWQADFLGEVGLEDLAARSGVPAAAAPVGADLGPLVPGAAAELGLDPATRVGCGLIDAPARWGCWGIWAMIRASSGSSR